jgi:hypothetical protein
VKLGLGDAEKQSEDLRPSLGREYLSQCAHNALKYRAIARKSSAISN